MSQVKMEKELRQGRRNILFQSKIGKPCGGQWEGKLLAVKQVS
jgi:hypothetical protein